ncbi:hypothetical protein LUZ60_004268 [Juncus effusus]|nr:hypothetical protein LUZ60_004268 [Juncus effusus]
MKLVWKSKTDSKKKKSKPLKISDLPFETSNEDEEEEEERNLKHSDKKAKKSLNSETEETDDRKSIVMSLQSEGNRFAEAGKYREALSKWESALNLMPENEILHEQKAQILLELGDSWNALKSASRATDLKPSWPEAWITLGRAQLNFGEPDSAIKSFDKALALNADCEEAKADRQTAMHLVQERKNLHSSGLSETKNRFNVGNKVENSQGT